jgi:hypothetical protein|tara:strand:+ start:215 stop:649 length:435 start_codon:yes stop_codon:yes gene_type:complete
VSPSLRYAAHDFRFSSLSQRMNLSISLLCALDNLRHHRMGDRKSKAVPSRSETSMLRAALHAPHDATNLSISLLCAYRMGDRKPKAVPSCSKKSMLHAALHALHDAPHADLLAHPTAPPFEYLMHLCLRPAPQHSSSDPLHTQP